MDSERLAASIVAPYSQTFSMLIVSKHECDKDVEEGALKQLAKMRQAMDGLLGTVRADEVIREVEASVKVQMDDYYAQEAEVKEKEAEGRRLALEKKKEREEGERKKEEEEKKREEFTDRLMKNMSVTNERLCHEIILDPGYKIPGSSQEQEALGGEGGAGGEGVHPQLAHAKTIEEKMKKVFWQGLVTSLTPPEQATDEDFVEGAEVQCRYGSAGSYYLATIVKEHEAKGSNLGKTFDVQFLDDTVRSTLALNPHHACLKR